jgi:prepilin-type N-terminal cleavage/methylation domain-containing protein
VVGGRRNNSDVESGSNYGDCDEGQFFSVYYNYDLRAATDDDFNRNWRHWWNRSAMTARHRNGRNINGNGSRGFTLLELLLVLAMSVVLSGAIAFAYSECVSVQRAHELSLTTQDHTLSMERELTTVIQGAQLSALATDTTSYFIGTDDAGGSNLGCDRLTVTTTAPGIPIQSIDSTDDYLTQQTEYGPYGGLAEASIGTNPIGEAGSHIGLFERIQHPSDGDPTQGGMETDLDSDVVQMGFQFWDGIEWCSLWDTQTGTRVLPQAVQVSYILKSDTSNTPHVFVVPIPSSTVTYNTPAPNDGAAS